jgi:DNA-binding NtrC family response regulator
LERALRLAEKTDVGSTIPDGYNLRQWKDHYYHVMKKHGVTRRALGITSHGLRHQNLQGLYARETGFEAPIKRPESRADLVAHRQALQIVVEAAGHSRPAKANAYLSTFHVQKKLSAPKISASDAREALEQTQGNKTHAAKALGISRQALYRLLEE